MEPNNCSCGSAPIEDGKDSYLSFRCENCGNAGPTFDFIYDYDEIDVDRARSEAVADWNSRYPAHGG